MNRSLIRRVIAFAARLEPIELGSGGMMRQSRRLAALSRIDSPSHGPAAAQAADRIERRLSDAIHRARKAPVMENRKEKMDLTVANRRRIAGYQSRLGFP